MPVLMINDLYKIMIGNYVAMHNNHGNNNTGTINLRI